MGVLAAMRSLPLSIDSLPGWIHRPTRTIHSRQQVSGDSDSGGARFDVASSQSECNQDGNRWLCPGLRSNGCGAGRSLDRLRVRRGSLNLEAILPASACRVFGCAYKMTPSKHDNLGILQA